MSKNEFQLKRTAFAHVVHAGHASATASTQTAAYIPAGAIVTGMRIFTYAAQVLATGSNATVTPYVGAVALASNNNVMSAVAVQTAVNTLVLGSAEGVYVPTGGYLDIDFGSSGDSDSTGMTGDFDIYVDYIYCPDRDLA
jgi:hypothetical protein